MTHPRDDEEPRPHPHEHCWMSVTNGWGEVVGYECSCGAYKSA